MLTNAATNYQPLCLGMSRYCEWDGTDTTYSEYDMTAGACTSRCKSYCNNYGHDYNPQEPPSKNNDPGFRDTNAAYPNGCFKCYGMWPGFYKDTPGQEFDSSPYFVKSGPCTA